MTTHLGPVRPPSDCLEEESSAFYNEAIKLYDILDKILADVYKAWRGQRSRHERFVPHQPPPKSRLGGLDTVLEIERQLAVFGANVPSHLQWTSNYPQANQHLNPVIAQQRNVLHARYIHLHLLVYRPIFTQLYSETVRKVPSSSSSSSLSLPSATPTSTLYTSMLSKCATACVTAAIDLTHLVYETYQTSAADAWWYNGFCTSCPCDPL